MIPGRTIIKDGKSYLYFSGTSYLGMVDNNHLQSLLIEGLKRYGNNFGGSRLSGIHQQLYADFEMNLSQWIGAPATIGLSSGTVAGQIVSAFFDQENIPVFQAPQLHPALMPRSKVKTFQTKNWTKELLAFACNSSFVLMMNSVDPLYCTPTDFDWIKDLPANGHRYIIVVDDSHGIGVLGQGRGVWPILQKYAHIELVVVGSLGKALGLAAGFIAGSETTIDAIKKSQLYGGASPLLPAYAHAFINGRQLFREAYKQLQFNIAYTRAAIGNHFTCLNHYPVFFTKNNQLASYLKNKDIIISSFAYPTPTDDVISRVVVSSCHHEEDLRYLIESVQDFVSLTNSN